MKFFILVHPSNLQETVVQTTAHLETNRFLPSEPIMQMTVQLFPKVEFNREIIFAIRLHFYLCSLSCLLHHGFEIYLLYQKIRMNWCLQVWEIQKLRNAAYGLVKQINLFTQFITTRKTARIKISWHSKPQTKLSNFATHEGHIDNIWSKHWRSRKGLCCFCQPPPYI